MIIAGSNPAVPTILIKKESIMYNLSFIERQNSHAGNVIPLADPEDGLFDYAVYLPTVEIYALFFSAY